MRKLTPTSILDDVLSTDVAPDRTALRGRLRYDYAAVPALHRKAVEDAAIDILANGQRMKDSAITVGERLLDAKQRLEHGQFSDWCTVEFDMSQRTAQNLMNVARQFAGKSETVSLLSDSALYLLAAPSTPEAVREIVIEQTRSTGKPPTKTAVKAVIDAHKPAVQPQVRRYESGLPALNMPMPAAPQPVIVAADDRPLPAWVADDPEPEAPAPVLPAELRGWSFRYNGDGTLYLEHDDGRTTESESMEDVDELIAQAERMDEGLLAYGDPDPLTASDMRVMKPAPAATPTDDKVGRIVRLIGIYRMAIRTFDEYGDLIGAHTETLPAKRELDKMIAHLEREAALLEGRKAPDAWQVEEAWL